MLLLAAAALAASAPPPAQPAGYAASARGEARVRIVSGVRLSFGGPPLQSGTPKPRLALVKGQDGQLSRLKIYEFQ
jgi:hypothetical protein